MQFLADSAQSGDAQLSQQWPTKFTPQMGGVMDGKELF